MTTPHQPDPAAIAARNRRNVWLGLALLGFVLLVGLATFVRLSSSDPSKGGFYYFNNGSTNEAPELPPGITPEQAAPPPNLSAEPSEPEPEDPET